MRKAKWSDKELYADIFTEVFAGNTGTTWVLRKNIRQEKALRRMAMYTFVKGMIRDGVYISDNENGIGVCFRFNYRKFSIRSIWAELVFAITALSIRKLPQILRREAYRKNKRPASGNYLYYWFLDARPGERSAALEMGKEMLEIADNMNLPIYLETAVERIKPVYERYGFETFHYWEIKEKSIQFWFLKHEPNTS